MKKLIFTIFLAGSMALSLGACNMQNKDIGTIVGGGTGAVAGNMLSGGSPVGTAVGAVAGGVGGYYLGKSADKK